ncbi:hypothetical protein C8Q80DRAFT_1145750 [Daedaleopsis nitida]|nr:hypothetical protein C8Q80DRAFT_1145750 [Daedaleopsis nitida]
MTAVNAQDTSSYSETTAETPSLMSNEGFPIPSDVVASITADCATASTYYDCVASEINSAHVLASGAQIVAAEVSLYMTEHTIPVPVPAPSTTLPTSTTVRITPIQSPSSTIVTIRGSEPFSLPAPTSSGPTPSSSSSSFSTAPAIQVQSKSTQPTTARLSSALTVAASFSVQPSGSTSPQNTVTPVLFRSLSRGAIEGAAVGGVALLAAIAFMSFHIGRRRRKHSEAAAIETRSTARVASYGLAGTAVAGDQTNVQDCAELAERPMHTPSAVPLLKFSPGPTQAASLYKDRTHHDRTGVTADRQEDHPENGSEERAAGSPPRQAHDGGVRLAGGRLGATDFNSERLADDHVYDDSQTVVSSTPSTAPPPYHQY